MVANLYGDVDMTQVMFGINARRVGAWAVFQNQEAEGTIIAGASRMNVPLMYGTNKVHTLFVGEIIFRPQLVIASDDFKGKGAGGFWTDPGFGGDWVKNGDIIIANKSVEEQFGAWW